MMKNSLNCPKFKIEANKFVVFKIQLLQKKANFVGHKIRS